ncbi:hypothetical protein JNUCC1_00070 [Lentibacillus sp. JNUCC-1]|nr:GapA-binding peptide SR1P [Lentibacillus sp. JNUCC-1]MUV36269.1 hypothetical protein [Lentibacillus sp. JNUCC-1]
MGTIICKECHNVIEHYDEEKVTTLYGKCPSCGKSES